MSIDLHCHTHYSDGRFSPGEVIEAAVRKGLRTLAITDHDNIRGSLEAAPLAAAAGLELIPAVEFTTSWPAVNLPPEDANVDLLGYCFDPSDPVFRAFTRATLNDMHDRIGSCCESLTALGCPLTLADVLAENPRYAGALQLIDAIAHKGYAPNREEAMRLLEPVWFSLRDTPFTIYAAIEQIHLAGGAAVLAHPSIVRPRGQELTALDLRRLVDAGLDGIEVYHYRLDAAARKHFLALAREFNLLVTGGSDTHGWHGVFERLGQEEITAAMVEALRDKSKEQVNRNPLRL